MLRQILKLRLVAVFWGIFWAGIVHAQNASPVTIAGSDAGAEPPEAALQVSTRSALVVKEFSVGEKAGWPYDVRQLQSQSVAELRAKCGGRFDVLVGPPATPRTHLYTLNGEIVAWHPGNRAKRLVVGMGSGRESAEIRYWVTDENGKEIFEHKDTIRAEFWGNGYAGSVGELAHPFASKIADCLTEAKLF